MNRRDAHPRVLRCEPVLRGGFTLVELVVSMAVTSLLMFGLASTVLLASKALPDAQSTVARLIDGSEIVHQLTADLQEARYVVDKSATAITFTVADRDADGSPERIRYAWSGAPGAPLTRQYNGGTVVTLLADVHAFALAYDIQMVSEQYPGPLIESAETELAGYNSASNLGTLSVYSNLWWAEYFRPTLPADAVSWKVTRAQFMAKRAANNNNDTTIALCLPQADNTPSATVVDSATMRQNSLANSYQWQERAFANAAGLSPDTGLCLTFTTASANSCALQYQSAGVVLPNAGLITGTPAWQGVATDKALLFHVFGTVSTPGPPQTATREYLTGIRLSLQVGEDDDARLDTGVRMLNTPELLTALWELDFDSDPRTVDVTADGAADWADYSQSFQPATLSSGIWYAPDRGTSAGISTVPNENFAELTTVDLRYRATSVGGYGALFWINADRHDNASTNLILDLYKPDATSQELWVGHELLDGTDAWLAIYPVPDDFVDVRMIIDPDAMTFAVFVDGVHKGTFHYLWGNSDPDAKAWVYTQGCSAEFDHVLIRVGGSTG